MTFVALPLVLPIDNMTSREWRIEFVKGRYGPDRFALVLEISAEEEPAVVRHLKKCLGPADRPMVR